MVKAKATCTFDFEKKMRDPLIGGGGEGGGQPFNGQNSLTDHKKTSDIP